MSLKEEEKQKKNAKNDDLEINQSEELETEETENKEEKIHQENEKLKLENDELKKAKLFLLAEMANKQTEMKSELKNVYQFGNKRVILWVLRFLNDLDERALKFMGQEQDSKVVNHYLAVKMMRDNLWNNLQNEGVKEMKINEGSDLWDSRLHEFSDEVSNEELPNGTIVKVESKGYFLFDRVLQPAKVVISKKVEK